MRPNSIVASALAPFIALMSCSCAAPTFVPLIATAGVPITPTPTGAIPLEVRTRSTGVHDPLPVKDAAVVYGELEGALGHAVASACAPWAEVHRGRAPQGYQLSVELIRAEAAEKRSRFTISLGVRATLRARHDNTYIAQSQAFCSDAGLVAASNAGPVIYSCMMRLGRDLAGWLGSVEP
jgi:hypothetical protein